MARKLGVPGGSGYHCVQWEDNTLGVFIKRDVVQVDRGDRDVHRWGNIIRARYGARKEYLDMVHERIILPSIQFLSHS